MAASGDTKVGVRQLVVYGALGGVAMTCCSALIIAGFALFADASSWWEPRLELPELAQRSTITDAQGRVLGHLGTYDRASIALEQIPKLLQDAVVAVEDETFWSNVGIDVHGVLRAAATNLESGTVVQGGSTITQQLVKIRLLTSDRSVERKLREMVLARQLTEQYSKPEILEHYLNTVYFGQGAYGVQSAMERLFLQPTPFGPIAAPLAEITPGQAALLAGLIANPEGNNPFTNPDGARMRRDLALNRMVDQQVITAAQATLARAEPLPSILPVTELRPRTSWVEEVQDRILHDPIYAALGATPAEREQRLLTGGLHVTTTLDPATQAAAENAMTAILPEKPGFTGALVAMDPSTGDVKAMVAGPGLWTGFEQSQYNIATSPPGRQAGSTWKVITLAAALDHGFSPDDRVSGDSPCAFGPLGETRNSEEGGGIETLWSATVYSVNCAFARTELAVGFPEVIDTARRMGIEQQTLQPVLTLTLGAIESTPLEMVTVASTIANGGIHHRPNFVRRITTADGTVVFDAGSGAASQAIPPEVAACETSILQDAITWGTGGAARLGERPVAGKTGTTDELADANFLGFTPQLAAFVWHGDPTARVPGAGYGGDVPARIFQMFMSEALHNQPIVDFPDPGPICQRPPGIVSETGRRSGRFPASRTPEEP